MSQQVSGELDSENRIQEGESRETGAESGDQALDIWRGENNDGVICFLQVITVRGDPGEIVEIRKRNRMEREQQTRVPSEASGGQIEAGDSQEGRSRTETTHFSPLGEASVENSNPQQVTINENVPSSTDQSSEPMRNSPKSPSRSLDAIGQAPSPLPPEPLSASNHASLLPIDKPPPVRSESVDPPTVPISTSRPFHNSLSTSPDPIKSTQTDEVQQRDTESVPDSVQHDRLEGVKSHSPADEQLDEVDTFIPSLVVCGPPGLIIDISRNRKQDEPLPETFRKLEKKERKALMTYYRNLEAERREIWWKAHNPDYVMKTQTAFEAANNAKSYCYINPPEGSSDGYLSLQRFVTPYFLLLLDRKFHIEDQRTVRPTPSRVFSEVVGVPYQEEEDTEMALVPAEITQTSSKVETESKTNEQADSNPPTVAAGKADEKKEAVPPSSDLSDCEDELAGSQEEDSGDEPISEVLAKRIAGRADQRPPRASRPKDLPQYLDELLADEDEYVPWWADKSVSDLVKRFVEDRESIFEMQKTFRSLKKEAEALAIVTTRRSHIDNLKHRNYLDELLTYIAFFRIMKLNPFPISNALVAVYMYQYRAQWPEESRAKTAHALGLFARWTSPLFGNDDPRLIRLNNWEGADEVIKEMERSLRKTMKTRSDMTAATSQSVSPSSSRAAVHSTVAAQPSRSVSGTPPHSTPSIPQLESRETTATPTLPPPQKKRKAGRPRLSASNSRTKNPSEPPSVKEISPAPSSTSETVLRKIRRNIPLPNVRDRFESLRAVKMSTAASLIYSQGYAIGANPNATETTVSIYCRGPGPGAKGCSFRIHASFDAEEDLWKVDSRIAQHTHKPSTTLNDPDWRPRTTDLDIIEAIRQIDEYNQLDGNLRKVTKEKRALRRSTASEPPSKRIRTTSPTPSVSISESIVESQEPRESSTRANSPSPAPFLKSDVASSFETSFDTPVEPSIGLVAGVSHLLPTGERTAESVEASAERCITTPMVESKPILPSPPRSSRTPTSVPPLARIPTVDSSTPNDERSFYSTPQVPAAGQQLDLSAPPVPQVAAFLSSFDPSLTVLAPYLQAAGYSTLNALVEFALLSPRLRKIVFKSISARTDTAVDSRLFDLLDQRLTEAREAGWV